MYWIVALPAALIEDVLQASSFQPLAVLHQVNLFTTVTSALLKLRHWARQGVFSEMLFNQHAAVLAIRVTNAELDLVYKSSDGVGGLLNYRNVSYSGQSFCFTKELGTALLEWQLESAIVLRFNA